MESRGLLRGGSLIVAVGALAALVLHACASTDAMSSSHAAGPQMQAATAQQGSMEGSAPNATPNATATTTNPPATANDDGDDEGPYFPATKAGPGIVLSKPKHPKVPPQMQNANPPPQVAAP